MLRYIPNIITILRIVLVVPIVWLLLNDAYFWAIILIGIAGLSDALDGYLARRFNWQSSLGAMLDPLADKIFLFCMVITLGLKNLIPLWLMAAVLIRDIIILLGAALYQLMTKNLRMKPLIVSKLNTVLLVILVLLVTLNKFVFTIPEWVLDSMITAVAISTFVSGIAYVILWTRYAIKYRKS